jgi:tetratricopeptide (TPR) repeat protein
MASSKGAKKKKGKQEEIKQAKKKEPLSPAKARLFLLITLFLPFFALGALELGLRAADYGGSMAAFDTPERLGGRYRIPGARLGKRYFPREEHPPSPPGDLFLTEKPGHSMRIFVLGESSAAGFPYSANGAFARVLRDVLTDVLPSDTVEVINMGMAATNSYTIVDLSKDIIAERPDAVMIYGGHNEYYGALGAGSTESLGSFPGLVRQYLRLQNIKTVLLLRNVMSRVASVFRGGRTTTDIEADATRMESVVANQRIALGDDVYNRALRQYESNLRVAMVAFRRAGIPVFVGSTPSNVRDLNPFGTSIVPPDSTATHVFDSAKAILSTGDSVRAGQVFARARDIDVVRFRAPSEFQRIVQRVATETGSTYVPAAEEISKASRYGIPGGDLFLEHVHPNQRGYVLLARAYYDALARARFLGRTASLSNFAGWDAYTERMRLTELDHRIAYHTIKTVTTRWPFLPVAKQLDYRGTYRPVDFLDSVAFGASRGAMPWAQAKVTAAARFVESGETDRAIAEYDGLIRDGPQVELAYRLAGRALLEAKQEDRARPYLEKAHALEPSSFSAYALGVIAMRAKDTPRAVALLQQALQLTPDMPAALYQLSLAYAVARNIDGARAAAARLAQVQPRFPGLDEWMAALGMTAGR